MNVEIYESLRISAVKTGDASATPSKFFGANLVGFRRNLEKVEAKFEQK